MSLPQQVKQLKAEFQGKSTLFVGISHQHPQVLKNLQISLNDQVSRGQTRVKKSGWSGMNQSLLEEEAADDSQTNDNQFELLFVSDYDFETYKHTHFSQIEH